MTGCVEDLKSTARSNRRNAVDKSPGNGRASQNVKTHASPRSKKQALKNGPKLARTTFRTNREMDFFSAKELTTQTGHAIEEWPLVIVKELLDNALDACEEADIAPLLDVNADAGGITIRDNGPGIPDTTLEGALDFTVRVSNREAYVAPDRGAQGNALKTLVPMAGVLDPGHGKLIITAQGKRHAITCRADPISQLAIVNRDVSDLSKSKKHATDVGSKKQAFSSGTEIRIEWSTRIDEDGNLLWPFDDLPPHADVEWGEVSFADQFRFLVEGFALFNPHLTISLDWFGRRKTWKATNSSWEKWRPNKPTSAHWYEQRHLERLIGAYITHGREAGIDRLVSELLAEFDGLSGSQTRSKVLDVCDLRRVPLSAFVVGDRLDSERIAQLLAAMQQHTRPVNPRRLGIIGEEHMKARLLAMGVQEASFSYHKLLSKEGVPWVLECAFGWLGDEADDWHRIITGANWSAAIKNPYRSFGRTGEGLEALLTELRVGAHEPVVIVLHAACPRIEYTDRGKSALVIGDAA